MFVKFAEWAPDNDQTIAGLLVDIEDIVPTLKGVKGAPSAVSTGLAALNAECRGSGMVTILSGANVLFAGTQTELFKGGATAWTDVTRVSGDYTGSATSKWRFAQVGDVTLAVNKVDTCQRYNHATDTDFSDLTAMPKCAMAEAVGQFVMVANYNTGTDTPDGWACSALGDYTDWTASVDTQATYGRLTDTPGEITALRRLADYAIYYKKDSMYLARYVGQPSAWEFSLVSDKIGAVSQEAVAKVGGGHYFCGADDFYVFDSTAPRPIGSQRIKYWFNADCNNANRHKTVAVHDRINSLVYWYYPSGTSTTLDSWVAYNYETNKWGKGSGSIEAAVEYVEGGKTYSELNALYATYSAFPITTYAALGTSSGTPLPAIFDAAHTIKTLSGVSTSSSITTNDFGQDDAISLIRRVRPRYLTKPTTGTLVNYYRDGLGDDLTTDATTTESGCKYDVLRAARWHRGKLSFTGDVEITGLDVDARGVSQE